MAYRLTGDTWTEEGMLKTPRGWHACSYRGSYLYVMGGYDGSYLSSTEVLPMNAPVWTVSTPLPRELYGMRGITLGNTVFLTGERGQCWDS